MKFPKPDESQRVTYNPDGFEELLTNWLEKEWAKPPQQPVFYTSHKRFCEAVELIRNGKEKELQYLYPFCFCDKEWIDSIKEQIKRETPI